MVPPFGFSVSDFISGINLVRELIKALEDSAGSSAEYLQLISELYSLERALLEVKNLELDESQHLQSVALQQAAGQCQQTIDNFLRKIKNLQPSLRIGGSGSRCRDTLRKVEWALCKKEDVRNFRAQLSNHTASISIWIGTIQLQNSTINSRKLEQQRDATTTQHEGITLANQGISANREILNSNTDHIISLIRFASNATTQEQNQELKEIILKILKENLQIYDMVCKMHASLPRQIERQQPVILLDACARVWPVHLEFITSAEAFLAVLKVHFQDAGLRKIEKGQFVLEEARTKQAIDLRRPWHTCVLPGQKIDMSMIVSQLESPRASCPLCHYESEGETTEAIECVACGIYYRRIVPSDDLHGSKANISTMQNPRKRKLSHLVEDGDLDGSEASESEPEDDIHLFRRVHIKPRKATTEKQVEDRFPKRGQRRLTLQSLAKYRVFLIRRAHWVTAQTG